MAAGDPCLHDPVSICLAFISSAAESSVSHCMCVMTSLCHVMYVAKRGYSGGREHRGRLSSYITVY